MKKAVLSLAAAESDSHRYISKRHLSRNVDFIYSVRISYIEQTLRENIFLWCFLYLTKKHINARALQVFKIHIYIIITHIYIYIIYMIIHITLQTCNNCSLRTRAKVLQSVLVRITNGKAIIDHCGNLWGLGGLCEQQRCTNVNGFSHL
jgi:hypothetical protein